MSGSLIRGGSGSEIHLRDILPSTMRGGLITRSIAEPFARKYEQAHPGCVVVCDWELISDEDIAQMDDDGRRQALADRASLKRRRDAAAEVDIDEPSQGGDPERVRVLMQRAEAELARLDKRSSAHEKRFAELTGQINAWRRSLGLEPKKFDGAKPEQSRAVSLTEPQKKELDQRLKRYNGSTSKHRTEQVRATSEPFVLHAFLEAENDAGVRQEIAVRLTQIGATVAA